MDIQKFDWTPYMQVGQSGVAIQTLNASWGGAGLVAGTWTPKYSSTFATPVLEVASAAAEMNIIYRWNFGKGDFPLSFECVGNRVSGDRIIMNIAASSIDGFGIARGGYTLRVTDPSTKLYWNGNTTEVASWATSISDWSNVKIKMVIEDATHVSCYINDTQIMSSVLIADISSNTTLGLGTYGSNVQFKDIRVFNNKMNRFIVKG